MKKLFFTICFILICVISPITEASITPIAGVANKKNTLKPVNMQDVTPDDMPDPQNQDEVREFFKKRLDNAARMEMNEDIDIYTPSSVNIIHTEEYYKALEEEKKPLFQKMYEKALQAVTKDGDAVTTENPANIADTERQAAQTATRFFTISQPEEVTPSRPEIPTVSLSLPSGRRILAPALEHIPYFLSYIDIQANGYIKVEDTITVVADGKKFSHGLQRVFSKWAEKNKRIELILNSVTINDTKVPYTIEEIGDNLIVKPKYNQKLEPGVYTYKFDYIVNNKLRPLQNNYWLDWNLTGRPLNAFITSANAIVSIPQGHTFDEIVPLVGSNGNYTYQRTNAYQLAGNVIAFSNITPLFNGESMHIMASMNKNVFIKNFDKNFSNFILSWGNVAYALAGLVMILAALLLSLFDLKHEQKKNKYNPSYNGSLMRSILVGKYDRLAFVSQLLELFRKNALDITQKEGRIYLKPLNYKSAKLSNTEKKALTKLFNKKSTDLEVNNVNNLRFKKAKRVFEKSILKQIKKYRLIHNISYLAFSCLMMLLTEIFIAKISVNFAQSLIILLSISTLFAFYIWIIRHNFKYRWIGLPIKFLSMLAIIAIWGLSTIYIGGLTGILILLMVITIFAFTRIFAEQNNFINEAKDTIAKYKEYLISNAEAINLSRDFINQQSNIFALNIVEYFPQNNVNQNNYRLDIAETLKQTLIGII